MRWSCLVFAVLWLTAATALAKPKVAVAPFKGDKGNKVADAIAEALEDHAKVTPPATTGKAFAKAGVSGEPDIAEAKKLETKLGVDAIVTGRLEKEDGAQKLKVVVFVHGKEPSRFTVQFKTTSKQFKEDVGNQIAKKLGDDDDGKRRLSDNDDRKTKKDDDDRTERDRKKKDDDDRAERDRKKKKDDDEIRSRKKKEVADEDDGRKKKKRKRRRTDTDEDTVRLTAARLDAGGFAGVRKLTYSATMSPPPVGTRTIAARVEGEIYPFAFGETQKGGAAGFGIGFEYEKTLGLTIDTGNRSFPIDQGHYAIGARYRIAASSTTMVVVGLDYAGRHYIADRTAGVLDMPDTNYKAVQPTVCVMKLVKPTVGVFGRLGGELIMDTGRIQDNDQYGPATVYGLDFDFGTDIGLSPRLALRLAADINQISLKFSGTGAQAMARGVTAATDRQLGLTATLAVTY